MSLLALFYNDFGELIEAYTIKLGEKSGAELAKLSKGKLLELPLHYQFTEISNSKLPEKIRERLKLSQIDV